MPILILATLGLLVVGAGGLHPGVHPACVIAVAAGLLAVRPAANQTSVRALWLSGLVFLLWTACTLLPVPAAVSGILGSKRLFYFEQATQARRDLQILQNNTSNPIPNTATAAETRTPVRLSLNRAGTQRFFLLAAGAWCLFWLTASASSAAKRRLLKMVVAGGTAVVLTSLLFRQACFEKTLFIFPWDEANRWEGKLFGLWPFINVNHFASFAAMLAPAAFCLAVRPRRRQQLSGAVSSKFGADIRSLSVMAERMVWVVALGILAAGVLIAGSRSGALALLLAILGTSACWLVVRNKTAATMATLLGIGLLVTLVLAPSATFQKRMESLHQLSEAVAESRLAVWKSALAQWQEFPLAGGGMESFRVVGNLYKTQPMEESAVYAHCEYLQLLADGGILCATLFLAMLATYLWTLFGGDSRFKLQDSRFKISTPPNGLRLLADAEQAPLKIAALGAGIVLLIHASSDFPCRIPLNACLAAVLLGIGISVRRKPDEPARPRDRAWRVAMFGGSLFLLGLVLWTANNIGGDNRQNDRPLWNKQASLAELTYALKEEPTYWAVWYEIGRKSREIAVGAMPMEKEFARRPTTGWLTEKFRPQPPVPCHPFHAPRSQPPAPSSKKTWLVFSGDSFRRAAEYNPKNPQVWTALAALEFEAGHPAAAREAYAKLLELAPERAPQINKILKGLSPPAKPGGGE